MKQLPLLKLNWKYWIVLVFPWLLVGCERSFTEGNLEIMRIDHREVSRSVRLELPNGYYQPDNPNFNINLPETWTGNMAQFVVYYYTYQISYQVKNTGNNTVFDSELDLYYTFNNGGEQVETIWLGDIRPGRRIHRTFNLTVTNKQLLYCDGEIYWWN